MKEIKLKLHRKIAKGKVEGVKTLLNNFKDDRKVYNDSKESAVFAALKLQKFDIYEVLITNGFDLGPHEDFSEIKEDFSLEVNRELRDIHQRSSKDPNRKHIATLISRSRVIHNSQDKKAREHRESIAKSFEELNAIEWIEPLLKLVAASKDLKLIFDFERNSTEHLDPTTNQSVKGNCYHWRGHVNIGAENLLESKCGNENEIKWQRWLHSKALGVVAHETSHYACNLLFGNDCKPYKEGDEEAEREFNEILEDCRVNKNVENFIRYVFDYPPEFQHAELIVRVPHILALYKNDPGTCEKLKLIYKKLFDFFKFKILDELKRVLPLMEAKNEIEDINDLCGISTVLESSKLSLNSKSLKSLHSKIQDYEKIQIISTNCPQLTMIAIYQTYELDENLQPFCIYARLETFQIEKILKSVIKMLKACENFRIIVDCANVKDEKIDEIAQKFLEDGLAQKILFVTFKTSKLLKASSNLSNIFKVVELEHFWTDLTLTEYTKEMFFNSKIIFQGNQMLLKDLVSTNSESIEAISLDINDVINRNEISVGTKIDFPEIRFYVQRKFQFCFFENEKFVNDKFNSDEILSLAESQKVILLSNAPGMGKTTELKNLAMKLKEKLKFFWIVIIDLKKFTKVFEEDKKFENSEEISSFFCTKILKLKSFEAEIFSQLFKDNKVVFLFDACDEISPTFKEFVMLMTSGIRSLTENQLFISTRPHLKNDLELKLNVKSLWLVHFDGQEQTKFLECFMEAKEFKSEVIAKSVKKIENFLENLSTDFSNPLLLRMIADIIDENGETKLSLLNCFLIYEHFIDKIIENYRNEKGLLAKKISDEFMKGTLPKIFEFHQKKAFEVVFSYQKKMKVIIDALFINTQNPVSSEEIARVGLMNEEFFFDHRTFAEFLVANFLFRNIFLEEQKDVLVVENCLKLFVKITSCLTYNNQVVNFFLDNALSLKPDQWEILKPFGMKSFYETLFATKNNANQCFQNLARSGCIHLIEGISKIFADEKPKLFEMFHGNEQNALMCAVESQNVIFLKTFWSFLENTFDQSGVKKFFKTENQNVFNYAEADIEVFIFLIAKGKLLMNNLELIEMIAKRNFFTIPLKNSRKKNPITFEKLFGIMKQNFDENELKIFLSTKSSENETILHNACSSYQTGNLTSLCETLEKRLSSDEMKILFQEKLKTSGITAIMTAANNENENMFTVTFNFICKYFDLETQLQILIKEDCNGHTVIEHAVMYGGSKNQFEKVKTAYEKVCGCKKLKEIFLKRRDGQNILSLAIDQRHQQNFDGTTIKAIWSYMRKSLDERILKSFLLSPYNRKKSILSYEKPTNLDNNNDEKILTTFMPFIIESFEDREMEEIDLHSLLCHAVKYFSIGFFNKSFSCNNEESNARVLNSMFLESLKENEHKNIFHIAATNHNLEVFDFLLAKAKSLFGDEVLMAFFDPDSHEKYSLKMKGKETHDPEVKVCLKMFEHLLLSPQNPKRLRKKQSSVLFQTLHNPNEKAFETILELLKSNFHEKCWKKWLTSSDSSGFTILHAVFSCNRSLNKRNSDFLLNFCEILRKNLTDVELKKLYMQSSLDGETPLMIATHRKKDESNYFGSIYQQDLNIFGTFWKIIQSTFNEETQKSMLLQTDRDKHNVIHLSFLIDSSFDTKLSKKIISVHQIIMNIFDKGELSEIIMRSNEDGETFAFDVLRSSMNFSEMFQRFWDYLTDLLESTQLKQFLLKKNKNGKSIFNVAEDSQKLEKLLEIIVPFIDKFFEEHEKLLINFAENLIKLAASTSPSFYNSVMSNKTEAQQLSFFYELFITTSKEGKNIFHFAASNRNPNVLLSLLEKGKLVLGTEEAISTFTSKDESEKNVLIYSLTSQTVSKSFIMHTYIETYEQVLLISKQNLVEKDWKKFLFSSDERKWTVLHYACDLYKSEYLERFCETIKEYLKPEELFDMFLTKSADGESACMLFTKKAYADESSSFDFIQNTFDLEKQKKILLQTNNKEETAINYTVLKGNLEFFDLVMNFYLKILGVKKLKQLIEQNNIEGENVVQVAMLNSIPKPEVFKSLWTFAEKMFDHETLKKIIFQRNKEDKTVFEKIRQLKGVLMFEQTIEIFMSFVIKSFRENEEIEQSFANTLIFGAMCFSLDFFAKIFELSKLTKNKKFLRKLLITGRNENGSNIFLTAAGSEKNPGLFKFLIDESENLLSKDELKSALIVKNYHKQNIFFYISRSNTKLYRTVCEVIKKEFSQNERKSLLAAVDIHDLSLIHFSAINSHEILQIVCNVLIENFTPSEFKSIYSKIDCLGRNALMLAVQNENINTFMVLRHFLTQFDKETQIEILSHKDNVKLTALHHAVLANELSKLNLVKELYQNVFGKEKLKEIFLKANDGKENDFLSGMKKLKMKTEAIDAFWSFFKTFFD